MFVKKYKKRISSLLVIIFMATIGNWDLIFQGKQKEETPERKIVEEIVEERTPTTKRFKNSDGTITIQQYNTPIHYEENGELKDIDSSLEKVTEEEKIFYKTKANDLKVVLPNEITNDNKVLIDEGEGKKYICPQS